MHTLWWHLIRFGFYLLYNEFAWTYDFVSWIVSLGYWRRWQQVCLQFITASQGELILELAHGTASLQIDLAQGGYHSVGLDLSKYMGHIARHKLAGLGIPVRLTRANAQHLPFAQAIFGTVVSTFPTEFIIQPEVLNEIQRVLVPGGRLLVVLNGLLTLTNPLVSLLEWLYRVTGQRGPWPESILDNFRVAGLEPELKVVTVQRSMSWVLVAVKGR